MVSASELKLYSYAAPLYVHSCSRAPLLDPPPGARRTHASKFRKWRGERAKTFFALRQIFEGRGGGGEVQVRVSLRKS